MKSHHLNQQFTRLLFAAHCRSGISCAAAADLAEISPAYLSELLSGHRQHVSLNVLRRLCERSWQLPSAQALRLFEVRLGLDQRQDLAIPVELYWRAAQYPTLQHLAAAVGVDRSYLTRILQGRRRPSLSVLHSLCSTLGLDAAHALRMYARLSSGASTVPATRDRQRDMPPRRAVGRMAR